MRVIICTDGKQITYEHVVNIDDKSDELFLYGSMEDPIHICLNGWLIGKASSCRIEKRCLICVDEVFLDTREDGV